MEGCFSSSSKWLPPRATMHLVDCITKHAFLSTSEPGECIHPPWIKTNGSVFYSYSWTQTLLLLSPSHLNIFPTDQACLVTTEFYPVWKCSGERGSYVRTHTPTWRQTEATFLVHRGEPQCTCTESVGNKYAHTCSAPLILGNSWVSPTPLKRTSTRAQAVCGGQPDEK